MRRTGTELDRLRPEGLRMVGWLQATPDAGAGPSQGYEYQLHGTSTNTRLFWYQFAMLTVRPRVS
eukprot:scaffold282410_cov22-Prasinocladus_malaysianus.AAC.1